jgi:hypothetical protein
MAHGFDDVRRVSDDELLSRLERLVKADRALSVKLLVHLGEVEARKLYLERGYSSMYSYCMTALGMSEAETYLRLLAAKTGKRLPLVLERLADGGLHLTAIKLLAPLLTESNHVALLDRARGMSKRQLEVLVAELAPKADFPERVRKLPESRGASTIAAQLSVSVQAPLAALSQAGGGAAAAAVGGAAVQCTGAGVAALSVAARGGEAVEAVGYGGFELGGANAVHSSDASNGGGSAVLSLASAAAAPAPFLLQPPATRGSTSPLSPGRFKLELTLGQEAYDQLEQLRELLRHQNPSGEITRIVERALAELLERTLKQRFAQTSSPRRQDRRARKHGGLDEVAERKAGSADSHEPQRGGSTLEGARGCAADSDATLAADKQPDGGSAERADSADARESQRGGSTLEGARGCAADSDATLAAGQQPDGGGAERADSADARESQRGGSTLERQLDDGAHRDATLPASHREPEEREPRVCGTGGDGVRELRVATSSRYVPRDVLREIYARDAGQCSYVSGDGRRCSARGFLEVHHREAFARGGEATVDNLQLTCRAHNFWLAEREMGRNFMQSKLLRT